MSAKIILGIVGLWSGLKITSKLIHHHNKLNMISSSCQTTAVVPVINMAQSTQTSSSDSITPEEQYEQLYRQMHQLCFTNNWGDPFSYARSREILMAHKLGHTIAVL